MRTWVWNSKTMSQTLETKYIRLLISKGLPTKMNEWQWMFVYIHTLYRQLFIIDFRVWNVELVIHITLCTVYTFISFSCGRIVRDRVLIFPPLQHSPFHKIYIQYIQFFRGLSWSCSYGNWIYNYIYKQCISPLKLCVWIPLMTRCTR